MNDGVAAPRLPAAALFVFAILLAVYGLSFSGQFTSDDEHVLAAGAVTLARTGRLSFGPAFGNSRLLTLTELPHFTPVEPLQPLLGSLAVRWADWAQAGVVHALFWSQAVVTALTGVVVFASVSLLGYSALAATATALAFGLGTLAWPYALTYFRDPLAALFVASAYYCFVLTQRAEASRRAQLVGWAGSGLFLLAAMAAKIAAGAALPAFCLAALLSPPARGSRARALLAAGGLAVLIVAATRLVPTDSRLSTSYFGFLLNALAFNRPRTGLVAALFGPFVSPGKSLFLYGPMPLLATAAWFVTPRERRRELLVPWLTLLALVAAQALFYENEWAGFNTWGLRFLLPALPLLTVACAPVLAAVIEHPSRRWMAWALVAFGAATQLGGVLVSPQTYYARLTADYGVQASTVAAWNFAHGAWAGQWQTLLAGVEWKAALTRLFPLEPVSVGLVAACWGAAFLIAWAGLRRALAGRAWTWLAAAALALSLALPWAMLTAYHPDPASFAERTAFREAVKFLSERLHPDDVVLLESYGQPLWFYAMGEARWPVEWLGLPWYPAPADALPPATVGLLEGLSATTRVWLMNDRGTPPGDLELEAHWLAAHWRSMDQWDFRDTQGRVQLNLFAAP